MRFQIALAAIAFTTCASTYCHAWDFEDWPMYGRDLSHSFNNPLTQINSQRRVIDTGMGFSNRRCRQRIAGRC